MSGYLCESIQNYRIVCIPILVLPSSRLISPTVQYTVYHTSVVLSFGSQLEQVFKLIADILGFLLYVIKSCNEVHCSEFGAWIQGTV